MLQSLLLRGVAFLIVLLLVGSMMLLFSFWVASVIQIGSTIFSSIAEGLSG